MKSCSISSKVAANTGCFYISTPLPGSRSTSQPPDNGDMSFSLPPQTRNACIPAAVLAVLPDLSAYQEEQGVCDTNIHIPQLADEAIEPSPAANCITGVPQRDGESRSTATPPGSEAGCFTPCSSRGFSPGASTGLGYSNRNRPNHSRHLVIRR